MKSFWRSVGCLLLLLMGLYVGCYFSLVQRHVSSGYTVDGHHGMFFTHPSYRGGGKATETLFAPAFWLDRRIRTRYWSDTSGSDTVPASADTSGAP